MQMIWCFCGRRHRFLEKHFLSVVFVSVLFLCCCHRTGGEVLEATLSVFPKKKRIEVRVRVSLFQSLGSTFWFWTIRHCFHNGVTVTWLAGFPCLALYLTCSHYGCLNLWCPQALPRNQSERPTRRHGQAPEDHAARRDPKPEILERGGTVQPLLPPSLQVSEGAHTHTHTVMTLSEDACI